MRFLFWNVAAQDVTPQLRNLVTSEAIDILILAENPVPPPTLVSALNVNQPAVFLQPVNALTDRVQIFPRLPNRRPGSVYNRRSASLL